MEIQKSNLHLLYTLKSFRKKLKRLVPIGNLYCPSTADLNTRICSGDFLKHRFFPGYLLEGLADSKFSYRYDLVYWCPTLLWVSTEQTAGRYTQNIGTVIFRAQEVMDITPISNQLIPY